MYLQLVRGAPYSLIIAMVLAWANLGAADAPDWVQTKIDIIKSPDAPGRVEAAQALIDGWQDSLPVLLQNTDRYWRTDSQPYLRSDVPVLITLTEVVRTIIVNQKGAFKTFVEIEKDNDNKTVKLAAWASGDPDRNLRINATYILLYGIENSNVCVVLDDLRNPDFSDEGLHNLLQAAIAFAVRLYKENYEETIRTVEFLEQKPRFRTFPLRNILDQLAGVAQNSLNKDKSLRDPPPSPYCLDYKPLFPLPPAP